MTDIVLNEDHIEFLNDLRDSGDTNMAGAGPYIQDEFDVDRHTARTILKMWMDHCKSETRG